MDFLVSRQNVKKSAWFFGALLAFLLPVAVYLFEADKELTLGEPVFWQYVVCCFIFSGALACICCIEKTVISAAVTVGGAVAAGFVAGSCRSLFFAALLPSLACLLLLRYGHAAKDAGNRFRLLCLALSALLLGGIVFLLIKIASAGNAFDFFRPTVNRRLSGFWPLAMLAGAVAVCFRIALKQENPAGDSPKKKKQKKAEAKKTSEVPVWFPYLPIFLFFVCAALCYIRTWLLGENGCPYPLLIDLSGLFVLLGISPVAAEKECRSN